MTRYRHRRGHLFDPLPPGVRLVTRPTRWGNRHPVGRPCEVCGIVHDRADAVAAHRAELEASTDDELRSWLAPLAASDGLACYCRTGEECHADALLEHLDRLHPRGDSR